MGRLVWVTEAAHCSSPRPKTCGNVEGVEGDAQIAHVKLSNYLFSKAAMKVSAWPLVHSRDHEELMSSPKLVSKTVSQRAFSRRINADNGKAHSVKGARTDEQGSCA